VAHPPAGCAVLAHSFHLRASAHQTDGYITCGARLRSIVGTLMALHFPNASRNYNPTQRCVCFWGHDSAFEVSFHLDEEALCKISPYVDRNEASLLHVFDVNRVRIQEAASVAYSRRRQNYHRLSASDLLAPVHRGRRAGGERRNCGRREAEK
jgi:Protein of unknown function (DUF1488)